MEREKLTGDETPEHRGSRENEAKLNNASALDKWERRTRKTLRALSVVAVLSTNTDSVNALEQLSHTTETAENQDSVERIQHDLNAFLQATGVKDIQEEGYSASFDHLMLGGDARIDDHRVLTDTPFMYAVKQGGKLVPSEGRSSRHDGATEYSLLLAHVDPKKTIELYDENAKPQKKSGKKMTVEELINYSLGHLQSAKGVAKTADREWVTLLALAQLKAGKPVHLKGQDGKSWSLEDLHKANVREFNYTNHPELLSKEERKSLEYEDMEFGTCKGTHALHAMVGYHLYKGDQQALRENLDFIFGKLSAIKSEDSKDVNTQLHSITHLLTPLLELPENHPFTGQEKGEISRVFGRMVALVAQCRNQQFSKPDIGSLSHASDVMNRMPPSWR